MARSQTSPAREPGEIPPHPPWIGGRRSPARADRGDPCGAPGVVSAAAARLSLAERPPGPVRGAGLRGDAAADAGGAGRARLRLVPRAASRTCGRCPRPARAEVLRAWGGLGYPRRALALREAARAIVRDHGGRVPSDLDELRALPGVGPYTAAAVASIAFGGPWPRSTRTSAASRRALLHGAGARRGPGPEDRRRRRRDGRPGRPRRVEPGPDGPGTVRVPAGAAVRRSARWPSPAGSRGRAAPPVLPGRREPASRGRCARRGARPRVAARSGRRHAGGARGNEPA